MSLALKIISSIVIKCCLCNNKKTSLKKLREKNKIAYLKSII